MSSSLYDSFLLYSLPDPGDYEDIDALCLGYRSVSSCFPLCKSGTDALDHCSTRAQECDMLHISSCDAATNTPSNWQLNNDARQAPANDREMRKREAGAPRSHWDDEWRFFFLMAVLTIGIGNAKTMSILKLMTERLPHRDITHKQVESYWQNFRGKLRRQHGLSPGEMPGNRHVPRMEDVPEELRHLAERWLHSDA